MEKRGRRMTVQTREDKLKSIYFTQPAANISSKVNLYSISPGIGFSNPLPKEKIKHPPSKLKSIHLTQRASNTSSEVILYIKHLDQCSNLFPKQIK